MEIIDILRSLRDADSRIRFGRETFVRIPNGHYQDASTCSNLLFFNTGITATCLIFCFPSPSQRQSGTLLILPLLARLVVSSIAFGSSLRGLRRTRMIRHVDGYSYSPLKYVTKADKSAMSLFLPGFERPGLPNSCSLRVPE